MMDEQFLREKWASEKAKYKVWGDYVSTTLAKQIGDDGISLLLPAIPRLKHEDSLIAKALYRNKSYDDPYAQITDKVGVRFVVLLLSQVSWLSKIIESQQTWNIEKCRDFDLDQEQDPFRFDYAAIHYVVNTKEIELIDGTEIGPSIKCEIQIKTILQHSYAELTHDRIYKSKIAVDPSMKRSAAKSMALLEATGEYFEQVAEKTDKKLRTLHQRTHDYERAYMRLVGRQPSIDQLEGLIMNSYLPLSSIPDTTQIDEFFETRRFIAEIIAKRADSNMLYRQPSILVIYYLLENDLHSAVDAWPLQEHDINRIASDLGISLVNLH